MMISLDLFTKQLKNDVEKLLSLSRVDLKNVNKETIDNFTSLLKVIRDRHSLSFHQVKLAALDFNKVLLPIFQATKENSEIHILSFFNCSLEDLDDTALNTIYNLTHKNIKNLDLSFNKLGSSNKTVNFLIQFLQWNIEKLNCDYVHLAECEFAKVREIIQSFSSSKSLTTLDLGSFNFEENIKICELLLILFSGNISNISLSSSYSLGQNMTIDDWIKVINVIDKKNKLKYLNVSNCGLGLLDMDARIQAEAGSGNPEAFIKVFGPFLQTTTIEVIDISGNDFLKETTIALLKYSMQNPKLKLICERNELTNKEIEELKMRFENEQKTKRDIPKIGPMKTFAPLLVTFPASTAPAKTLNDIKEPEKPKTSFK